VTDERRQFERIDVPFSAEVRVTDNKGRSLGTLRQVGRGGFLVEPEKNTFKKGKKYSVFIVDDTENIKRKVEAEVRYGDSRYVGFQFVDLSPDAAVEIGVIIGKYYSTH
jgi:hypothetical protein